MSEGVFRYDSREDVCVERCVTVWGCFDVNGEEDDERGKWRRRTVEEFAHAILSAGVGLTGVFVEVRENYGSGDVVVYGNRRATHEEIAEYDRRDKMLWLSAKGTYERGRAKWEEP
jgi:hypothetical protein